jgi:hypothetical protein
VCVFWRGLEKTTSEFLVCNLELVEDISSLSRNGYDYV